MTKFPSYAERQDQTNAQAATPGDRARVGDAFPTLERTATSGHLVTVPERALYRRLGVEHGPGALLSGSALRAAMAGEAAAIRKRSTTQGVLGPVKPTGGRFGLPADFLIAPDGRITTLKYGWHAYDQWRVDELLDHACHLDHARPVSA